MVKSASVIGELKMCYLFSLNKVNHDHCMIPIGMYFEFVLIERLLALVCLLIRILILFCSLRMPDYRHTPLPHTHTHTCTRTHNKMTRYATASHLRNHLDGYYCLFASAFSHPATRHCFDGLAPPTLCFMLIKALL